MEPGSSPLPVQSSEQGQDIQLSNAPQSPSKLRTSLIRDANNNNQQSDLPKTERLEGGEGILILSPRNSNQLQPESPPSSTNNNKESFATRLLNSLPFVGKRTLSETRKIYVNELPSDLTHQDYFPTNKVSTAKYQWWNFIPKNLLEQFMRLANVYFLIISMFQQIPGVSPTGKYTTLGPLMGVLAVTAIKEAFEDVKRHRQDRELNNRKATTFRDGKWQQVSWKDLRVGDLVQLKSNSSNIGERSIPADLVLLSSSEPLGICYIETSSLDGETNLKIRQPITETRDISIEEEKLKDFKAIIECEQPNNRLYKFDGSITLNDKTHPLDPKQILLRGATIRNTGWALGVIVFTGPDSKLMQNANKTRIKRTNVERITNINVLCIFGFQILLSILCAIFSSVWRGSHEDDWYLQFGGNSGLSGFLGFITFIILYNNLIPISLYVSMEIVKFGQAFMIANDAKLYHEETDTPAQARTSNLNEELGQIEFVFSDKTGTLTQNLMVFRKCTIGGVLYGNGPEDESQQAKAPRDVHFQFDECLQVMNNLKSGHHTADIIKEFLTCLSLCHTVVSEVDPKDPTKIRYEAASPDEDALVEAGKAMGFVFLKRTPSTLVLKVGEKEEIYELLNILEFNSNRKRMSIICRDPEGKLKLYCKGADSVIYERLKKVNHGFDFHGATLDHLQLLAADGLRTLCIAYTELDPIAYSTWNKNFQQASITLVNRDAEMERVAEQIEKDLILLGATAIEDKLQKGVPETIQILLEAGIKIWILTGDKQETAINIGFACSLLNDDMDLIILNESTREGTSDQLDMALQKYADGGAVLNNNYVTPAPSGTTLVQPVNKTTSSLKFAEMRQWPSMETVSLDEEKQANSIPMSENRKRDLALIIDGPTLTFALQDGLKEKLLKLGCLCKSVVCCRVSPLQKADVVRLVKDGRKAITLAIGDGANDVSMIQAAHVGVGISGVEGLQATRASDYSIAQFRFLKRLLLVHGRWNYRRITKLICYSFYKNVVLYITQFWFTVWNGFSGQSLYERWALGQYNVLFTFLPVIFFGLLDQDVDVGMVFEFPKLYQAGLMQQHYNIKVLLGWIFNAVVHSFIAFIIPSRTFAHNTADSDGLDMDLNMVGTVVYTCVILIVTFKLALETRYWTWITHLVMWGSIVVWFLFLMIYGVFWGYLPFLNTGEELFWVIYNLFTVPLFYFCVILTPSICLLRDVTWKYLRRSYRPRNYHIVQEYQMEHHKRKNIQKMRNMQLRSQSIESLHNINNRKLHTGFAFAAEEAFVGQSTAVLKVRQEMAKATPKMRNPFGSFRKEPSKGQLITPLPAKTKKAENDAL